MLQKASQNLSALGAHLEQKRLLIQYLKPSYTTQHNTTADTGVGSFYFLLGVGKELSVIRMVRKKEDTQQYNKCESELISRIQKSEGLRFTQGCVRWKSKIVWQNDPTSTLPASMCCVSVVFRENASSLATAKKYNTMLDLGNVGKMLVCGSFWLRRLWPIELGNPTQHNTTQHNRCPDAFVLLPYAQDDSQYTSDWKQSNTTRHNTNETLTGILPLDKLVFKTPHNITQHNAQAKVTATVMDLNWSLYDVLCSSKYGIPLDENGEMIGPGNKKDTVLAGNENEVIGPPPAHPPPPLEPPPVYVVLCLCCIVFVILYFVVLCCVVFCVNWKQ